MNINGRQGLLIGAPGGLDANNANPGTGRVYLVYGNFNTYTGQTVNLDTPTLYPNLTIVTFVSTATLGALGTSVAGGVNIFGDGSADIIMGSRSDHWCSNQFRCRLCGVDRGPFRLRPDDQRDDARSVGQSELDPRWGQFRRPGRILGERRG